MWRRRTAIITDEIYHGLLVNTRRKSREKKKNVLRRFWVKNPRRSENISDEKCYLYRSTRLKWCGGAGGAGGDDDDDDGGGVVVVMMVVVTVIAVLLMLVVM